MVKGCPKEQPGIDGLAIAVVEQARRDRDDPEAQAFLVELLESIGREDLSSRL